MVVLGMVVLADVGSDDDGVGPSSFHHGHGEGGACSAVVVHCDHGCWFHHGHHLADSVVVVAGWD